MEFVLVKIFPSSAASFLDNHMVLYCTLVMYFQPHVLYCVLYCSVLYCTVYCTLVMYFQPHRPHGTVYCTLVMYFQPMSVCSQAASFLDKTTMVSLSRQAAVQPLGPTDRGWCSRGCLDYISVDGCLL